VIFDCELSLPTCWTDASVFENALRRFSGLHEKSGGVTIRIPKNCKVMVDAAVRILSLVNQLDNTGRPVTLVFEEGEAGAMGYLNRIGFFDHLAFNILTIPERPVVSGAVLFAGNNPGVVELATINLSNRDESLPTRLADSLEVASGLRRDREKLGQTGFTVFAELIGNIFEHSSTQLSGFAGLQVYSKGGRARVVVSDSGVGILEHLRPTLKSKKLATLSDTNLIVEMFRQGISSLGADRGCGLKRSAEAAIKYSADLDVRLPTCSVRLVPSTDGYHPNMAYCLSGLPLIWGTHICFDFLLTTN
jgi:hypothetical protein